MDFRQLEEESIQRYLARCQQQRMDPHVDTFVKTLRDIRQGGGSLHLGKGFDKMLSKNNKFDVSGIRARDLLHMQNQQITTMRTPYANNIIRTGDDPNMDVVVGSWQSTWEHIQNSRRRGVLWHVEVQVALSKKLRNRVIRVTLFSPHVKKPDFGIQTLSQHLEDKRSGSQVTSKCAATWTHFLAEDIKRFEDGTIPGGMNRYDQNISVDGAIRLLRDVCEFKHPHYGAVSGDPFVRIQLERACGIVLRGSHLHSGAYVQLAKLWLQDMIDFTDADRYRFWDQQRQIFVSKGRTEDAPAEMPMELVWKRLAGG